MDATEHGGRYQLLASDFRQIVKGARRDAERGAREAVRLGIDGDDYPTLAYAEARVSSLLWAEGASFSELDTTAKVAITSAYIDAYRPAYSEAYRDEEGY